MGKTTNEAVTAKEKARKRMLTLYAARAARDTRIESAAAAAITAAEKVTAAQTDAEAARSDARLAYEAVLSKIDAAEQSARGRAEPAVSAALAELKTEKLTLDEIATLTDVSLGEVKRLLKSAVSSSSAALPVAVESVAAEPASLAG
jgi:DNA-directed RNA polymerase specialized sigma24 family protein